jgi:peroxiredoxin Q/BCP
MTTGLTIGDTAPDFTAPTNGGGSLTLSDLRGAPVVLYFYPKDDTPGCTTEARDFTALAAAFKDAGATVIGVSKDSVARHDKFSAKHDLGVTLVSDEATDICERYGVWGEKKNYGKTYMGITRATFLIGADGTIAQAWPKVKVAGHAEAVLAAVRALA